MMQDLTDKQRDQITNGVCPTCSCCGFRLGPQGGAAINIECVSPQCRARYNVVMFGGRCLMGQTIPRESDGGGQWPAAPPEVEQTRGHRGTFS